MIKCYLGACNYIENFKKWVVPRPQLKIKLISKDSKIPYKAGHGCAGYDIFNREPFEIYPNTRKLVPIGISTEFSSKYYLRIAPRSGLSLKGIDVGIDVGGSIIDSSYRGEINVLVVNNSHITLIFPKGTRIAQLIMERCEEPEVIVSDYLIGN